MRNYKHKIVEQCSYDEEPEAAEEEAIRIAAAANHLAEVYLWVWGKEGSRSSYRYARFCTIATMIGKMTPVEAAREAKCSKEVIYMNRKAFLERFRGEKRGEIESEPTPS